MQRHLGPGRRSMARRTDIGRALVAACTASLVGCGGGSNGGSSNPPADAAADTSTTPPPPEWWQPKVGAATNWDIQLGAPIDVQAPRAMYDLDLWSLVPAQTTIDYGDGDPVTVPAGAMAGTIAELHARTPSTIVICYVETGALELNRPDARKFPGYNADGRQIPDNPDPGVPLPAGQKTGNPTGVIGWTLPVVRTDTTSADKRDPSKRFLDVSTTGRAQWASIMFKRFALAKMIGCDGVDAAHNDVASYISGYTISSDDSVSWYKEVADQGHAQKLSMGMRNGDILLGQIDAGSKDFDWLVIERCGENEQAGVEGCDVTRSFLNAQKDVFAIEYSLDITGAAQTSTGVCGAQTQESIVDGLYKDVAVSSRLRTQCTTTP